MTPVLVGLAGLGTEAGLWLYQHQTISNAADSSAVSAATAGASFFNEAAAVAASYGFVNGEDGVTVTVNQPPQSGAHIATPGAVEVVIEQQRPRLFSALYSSSPISVKGRAVAVYNNGGTGCVLALNRHVSGAVSTQGSAHVSLQGCSLYDNSASSSALSVGGSGVLEAAFVSVAGAVSGGGTVTATNGIRTGAPPVSDPYANIDPPAFFGCDRTNFTAKSIMIITPGTYCGGMKLNAGANVILSPGVYYLDRGGLDIAGGATLTGLGVTLVFTSSTGGNWATATINGNANVSLTAPISGPTAGIVIFGERNMPVGTPFKLNGGSSQQFGGAIYAPKGDISFVGGSNTGIGCTQLVGDTVSFAGNSNLSINCSALGTRAIGSATAMLVE